MIRFSSAEIDWLRERHAWLRDFGGNAPSGVASMAEPHPAAIHFLEAKHANHAPSLPLGSCLILPATASAPFGLRVVRHDLPKIAVRALLVDLRAARNRGQRFELVNGVFLAPDAVIDASARIEPGAIVLAGATVGGGSEIHSGAVIRPGVEIGRRCRVQSGAVVGEDGFGHAFDVDGAAHQIPHMGGVAIGDDVDVGPNSVIAAGTIDPTRIGSGTKIDGNVYIGHNAQLGFGVIAAAGAIVGGSARVGNCVWLHPGAILRTKVVIGDRAVVGAGALVMKPVSEGQTVIGEVATDARVRLRREASIDQLLRGDPAR